jgi:hypothetical protein
VSTCVTRNGKAASASPGRPRARLGLVVPDRQVHGAGAPVDGHEQEALAPLAACGAQLGQVLHVQWTKPSSYSLNFAGGRGPPGRGGRRPAAQARGLEDAVDVVAVEVRQEVGDHEGEVVEREAGGPAQGADHGALLLAGLPGQPAGTAGMVPAVLGSALAPLADGLGADAEAAGQLAVGSAERAISARTAGVVRALGWIESIRPSPPPAPPSPNAVEAPSVRLDGPTRLIPTTFRSQTPSPAAPPGTASRTRAAPGVTQAAAGCGRAGVWREPCSARAAGDQPAEP